MNSVPQPKEQSDDLNNHGAGKINSPESIIVTHGVGGKVIGAIEKKRPFDPDLMKMEIGNFLAKYNVRKDEVETAKHLYSELGRHLNNFSSGSPSLSLSEDGQKELESDLQSMGADFVNEAHGHYTKLEEAMNEILAEVKNKGISFLFKESDGHFTATQPVLDKILKILNLMGAGRALSKEKLDGLSEEYSAMTFADLLRGWQKRDYMGDVGPHEYPSFGNAEDLVDKVYEMAGINELLSHLGSNLATDDENIPASGEFSQKFEDKFGEDTAKARLLHLIKYNLHHHWNSIYKQKVSLFDSSFANMSFTKNLNEPIDRIKAILEILIRFARAMETVQLLKSLLKPTSS